MFEPAVSDLWWKNAIVYCVDVATYMDGNGDGSGDFPGLTQRLPYLAGLGVSCLWLLPFYPTPGEDDGYDVSDYYGVDPRRGTLGEFVEFLRTARHLGIRVVIDLVVNHTSDQHSWFQSARSDPESPYRDWYVWTDDPDGEAERKVIFPDKEDSVWAYDEQAGAYYLHRFYSSEPDLNHANPAVRDEINRVMGFWLELGVSGFRVDAVPYIIEDTGVEGTLDDPHGILRGMRNFLNRRSGESVFLGEVNLERDERQVFFGDGDDEMTGIFDFLMSGVMFTSFAEGTARALAGYLRETPRPPGTAQWMSFVRNHDELNLSRIDEKDRETVMDVFAPEEDMRIYGRGIRRRLPPMVDGDRRRIELAYSLMLTMPATPVFLYGEEIGMGDDLEIEGRKSVRTVMQWSDQPNAGFSTADPKDTTDRIVDDGPFGYSEVNVARQRRDENSLLNRIERAIRVRKDTPEFGWGECTVLGCGDERVLAHRCDWMDGTALAVHNFSADEVEVRLEIEDADLRDLTDLFGNQEYPAPELDQPFTVPPYGYRWLRARRAGSDRTG